MAEATRTPRTPSPAPRFLPGLWGSPSRRQRERGGRAAAELSPPRHPAGWTEGRLTERLPDGSLPVGGLGSPPSPTAAPPVPDSPGPRPGPPPALPALPSAGRHKRGAPEAPSRNGRPEPPSRPAPEGQAPAAALEPAARYSSRCCNASPTQLPAQHPHPTSIAAS